ncbi:MAG: TonB-dependent receptor plug domain-containing protein, partial [Pseudomonadota bacterium]
MKPSSNYSYKTKSHRGAKSLLLMSSFLCSGLGAGVAVAQEATGAEEMDTVIVTSTRRAQNILDVPYNINVVTSEDIRNGKTADTAELLRSIPGAAVVDRGARNAAALNGIRIRGLNVDSGSLGDYAVASVATVSTYVNDTPVFANLLLEDLSQVEVLRGPQATLYGSGTLGGTVRYLVSSPTLDEFSASAGLTVSGADGSDSIGYKASSTVNIPLSEQFAVRATVAHHDFPGIVDLRSVFVLDEGGVPVAPDGVAASTRVEERVEDADTVDIWYFRAGALWKPNDLFSAEFNYFRQEDDIGGRRQTAEGADGYGVPYGRYESGSPQREPSEREIDLFSLEMDIDLGFATLSSSSSYYDQTGLAISDNTGFYANFGFLGGIYANPRPLSTASRSFQDEAFVQEIRLVSNGENTIDYVLGAYYLDETRTRSQDSFYRGFKAYVDETQPTSLSELVRNDQDFLYRYKDSFVDRAIF